MTAIYCHALISFTISMDSRHLLHSLQNKLAEIYTREEASAMARQLMVYHTNSAFASLLGGVQLEEGTQSLIASALEELLSFRPLQYVLGEADFLERSFKVREGVLIPRPETEEMVWRLIQEKGPAYEGKVLDVGTGSGCIAISLGLAWPAASVFAIDLSMPALEMAQTNALQLGAKVHFHALDFLQALPDSGPFDLIISNPPYIPLTEMADMHPNVVEFEPHMALFVEDPLIFFRRLALSAAHLLSDQGMLVVEGHHAHIPEVAHLFEKAGLVQVRVLEDFQGKARFVTAIHAKSPADARLF
jgi:release factor glutamine methyltransferase